MSHVIQDAGGHTFKSLPAPVDETRPANDWRIDPLPIIKLQDPPKTKCKRQLSSESDVQSSVRDSEMLVHGMKERNQTGGEQWNIFTDRTQSSSKLDCYQLKSTYSRFEQSSHSSPLPSNFSPKKFKSHAGSVTSQARGHTLLPARGHTVDKSIRQISLPQLLSDRRHVPEGSNSRSLANLAKMSLDKCVQRKTNCLHVIGQRNNSNDKLSASVLYPGNDYVRSEGLVNKRNYSTVQMSPKDISHSNTIVTNVKEIEPASKRWNTEPDVFVFPETRSEAINFQHVLDSAHADDADEPDGLDSPMDTDVFWENSEKFQLQNNVYKNFNLEHSINQPVSRQLNSSTSINSKRESHILNSYHSFSDCIFTGLNPPHGRGQDRSAFQVQSVKEQSSNYPFHSSCDTTGTGRQSMLTIGGWTTASEKFQVSDARSDGSFSSSFCNNKRAESASRHSNQYSGTLLHQKTERGHEEQPVWSMEEILDNSESDDIAHYLEQDESISCDSYPHSIMNGSRMFTRNSSDANNNMIKYDISGRKEARETGDDYIVTTRADTNVSYISLNESSSSLSSDDMEYGYDTRRSHRTNSVHSKSYLQQDVWDETDGKGRNIGRRQEAGNTLNYYLCDSLDARDRCQPHKADVEHFLETGRRSCAHNHLPNLKLTDSFENTQLDLPGITSSCTKTGQFKKEGKKLISADTSSDIAALNKIKVQSGNCEHSSRVPDGKKTKKRFSPTRSKLPSLASSVTLCLYVDKGNRNNPYNKCDRTQHNNKDTFSDNENFYDEVDGLGDEEKRGCQSSINTSSKQGPSENIAETVVPCFNQNVQTNATHGAWQSNQFPASTQAELTRSSHDTVSSSSHAAEIIQEEKHTSASQHKAVEHLNLMLDSELDNQGEHEQQYSMKAQKRHGHQLEMIVDDVNYSPKPRMRRRKSDTSLVDVTGVCMSRSRSSPSKLGMTEYCDRKQVIFHRPWQDQPTRVYQSLPRLQKMSEPGVRVMSVRRLTCPTVTTASSAAGRDHICENTEQPAQMQLTHQPGLPLEGESRQSGVIDSNLSIDPIAGTSTASGKHRINQHTKQTEVRSKRKLEFCKDDSWNQPPTRQETFPGGSTLRQLRQPGRSALESREPVVSDDSHVHMSRGYGTAIGQDEDRTQEVSGSTSSSRQHAPDSGASSRGQDEVDVRVQVVDVLQESSLLRQRLDRIYQADDRSCECSRIEQNILSIAINLFQTLGSDASCRENWMDELRRTNHSIRCALDLADHCRRLCRHGRQVTDIFPGSVVIRMKCRTLTSVVDLCNLHASGDLHQIFLTIFLQSMSHDHPGLTLKVTLDKESVKNCQEYFLAHMDRSMKTRPGTRTRSHKKVAPPRPVVRSTENLLYSTLDPGSQCEDLYNSPPSSVSPRVPVSIFTPQRERKFSFGEINRTAFQELNISDISSPSSPSLFRHIRDDVFLAYRGPDMTLTPPHRLSSPNILTSPKLLMSPGSSPLTSPRKLKVCDVISEQENIDQGDE